MMLLSIVAVTYILAHAQGVPTDCAGNYQKLLRDVKTLKENCVTAAFHDCCQIKELVPQAKSGTYEVADMCNVLVTFQTDNNKFFARCDMDTDGGKWLVIQRRFSGSVNFYRNWTEYVNGFGDLNGEFWYGLEKIHCLTTREDMELRIELGNGPRPSLVWTYQLFKVGGAETNYRLTIGEGQGVGGTFDPMAYHNGKSFTTLDRDNDLDPAHNCAIIQGHGAWWYGACYHANLNARYASSRPDLYVNGRSVKYTKIQMKIRSKRCSM